MENITFVKEGKTMIDVLQNKMVIDINEYKRLVDLSKHTKYGSDEIDVLKMYNGALKTQIHELTMEYEAVVANIKELKQQIKEISKKVENKNSWWKIWD